MTYQVASGVVILVRPQCVPEKYTGHSGFVKNGKRFDDSGLFESHTCAYMYSASYCLAVYRCATSHPLVARLRSRRGT